MSHVLLLVLYLGDIYHFIGSKPIFVYAYVGVLSGSLTRISHFWLVGNVQIYSTKNAATRRPTCSAPVSSSTFSSSPVSAIVARLSLLASSSPYSESCISVPKICPYTLPNRRNHFTGQFVPALPYASIVTSAWRTHLLQGESRSPAYAASSSHAPPLRVDTASSTRTCG